MAWAQTRDATVDALLRQGVALRVRHEDDAAWGVFSEALRRCGCAEAQGQLSLAEQALGRWADAEVHLAASLAASRDPWVIRNRRDLVGAQTEIAAHLGTVEVRCSVPDAVVVVGGRPATVTSADGMVFQVRVEPAAVTLEVRAPGYVSTRRTAEVSAGEITRIAVSLTPMAPREPPVATTVAASPAQPAAVDPRVRASVAAQGLSPVHGPSGVAPAVYWLGASAAAFLAGAVGSQVAQQVYVGQYNDDARCQVAGQTRDATCGPMGRAADTAQWLATAGYIAAGGLAVAACVTLLVSAHRADPHPAAVACGERGELGCRVRF